MSDMDTDQALDVAREPNKYTSLQQAEARTVLAAKVIAMRTAEIDVAATRVEPARQALGPLVVTELATAADRLRAAAEFLRPEFAAMFRGLARRMDMQDCVDYDEPDRQRIVNCAQALLGRASDRAVR